MKPLRDLVMIYTIIRVLMKPLRDLRCVLKRLLLSIDEIALRFSNDIYDYPRIDETAPRFKMYFKKIIAKYWWDSSAV